MCRKISCLLVAALAVVLVAESSSGRLPAEETGVPDGLSPGKANGPTLFPLDAGGADESRPAVLKTSLSWDPGHAEDHHGQAPRPDTHAPAGLMGDHAHKTGEVMVEYKFMFMSMDDNRLGRETLSDVAARTASGIDFMVVPTRMDMNMHMFHVMYAPSDEITLYMMPMWTSVTMDHRRMNGTTFRTHNEGFDDLAAGALWLLESEEDGEWIANLGFSVPTGDLNNRTDRAMPPTETLLPYPMRLGSGTFDARPGLTYKKYWERSSAGLQFQADLPVGENYRDYSVGNVYQLNGWFSQQLGDRFSTSVRFEGLLRENFNGADDELVPGMASMARSDMRGGDSVNLGLGFIWSLVDGSRLNFEWVKPIYQDLDGVQLETDYAAFASWSKAW